MTNIDIVAVFKPELEAVIATLKGGTPGEWYALEYSDSEITYWYISTDPDGKVADVICGGGRMGKEDAQAIATAHNHAAVFEALLEMVEYWLRAVNFTTDTGAQEFAADQLLTIIRTCCKSPGFAATRAALGVE